MGRTTFSQAIHQMALLDYISLVQQREGQHVVKNLRSSETLVIVGNADKFFGHNYEIIAKFIGMRLQYSL